MNESISIDLKPHHLGISVPDLEASIDWYHEKLGFSLAKRLTIDAIPAEIAFLNHGDFNIELFEISGASPLPDDRRYPDQDIRTNGTKHIAFAVQDLRKFADTLKDRGVDFAKDVTEMDQTLMAFIRDNAGNLIELIQQPGLF